MTTKQALALAGLNIIFAIIAMRWIQLSWEQLGYMINYVHETGAWGGERRAGVWSITLFGQTTPGQLSPVEAHFTNYPAIFFYMLAGVNTFFILAFILWNKVRKAINANQS
ncbi:MAG: hypothetical protein FWB88_08685 [Defluviitaleaceae bacterium]|nr:hypothetical protein [Defluviitaleaceae bacterium]MCL2240042.1 hypothetical protein [Defluviitaleaceae bacterium]